MVFPTCFFNTTLQLGISELFKKILDIFKSYGIMEGRVKELKRWSITDYRYLLQ